MPKLKRKSLAEIRRYDKKRKRELKTSDEQVQNASSESVFPQIIETHDAFTQIDKDEVLAGEFDNQILDCISQMESNELHQNDSAEKVVKNVKMGPWANWTENIKNNGVIAEPKVNGSHSESTENSSCDSIDTPNHCKANADADHMEDEVSNENKEVKPKESTQDSKSNGITIKQELVNGTNNDIKDEDKDDNLKETKEKIMDDNIDEEANFNEVTKATLESIKVENENDDSELSKSPVEKTSNDNDDDSTSSTEAKENDPTSSTEAKENDSTSSTEGKENDPTSSSKTKENDPSTLQTKESESTCPENKENDLTSSTEAKENNPTTLETKESESTCPENKENDSTLKSVEKVEDEDGSEILITVNAENDGDDQNDCENDKKQMDVATLSKNEVEADTQKPSSKGMEGNEIVIEESPQKKAEDIKKAPKITVPVVPSSKPVLIAPNTVVSSSFGSLPIASSSNLQYIVPSSLQSPKYINVNGQQILLTLPPVSAPQSIKSALSTNSGSQLHNVNVITGFPAPNYDKNPLDKSLDLDIPQASWEQIELIKFEVLSRKPDNAFWGGLANVSKKADVSAVTKFLFDIGSDLVKESAYEQIVQVQQKKLDSDMLSTNEKDSLQRMKKVVDEIKEKTKYLNDMPTYSCKCGFKTTSTNVLYWHKQYPHLTNPHFTNTFLQCVHCDERFDNKSANDLFQRHMLSVHQIMPRFLPKTHSFPCNMCPFEGSNKRMLLSHGVRCYKDFKQHLNQAPHHVDINLCMKNIFYKFQVHNKKMQAQQQQMNAQRNNLRSNVPISIAQKPVIQPKTSTTNLSRPVVDINRPIPPRILGSHASIQNSWQRLPVMSSVAVQIQGPAKPTVNQLLNIRSQPIQPVATSTNRSGFEVCEICGGYVKDRMSLRIHFFYAHKIEMPAHVFSKPLAPLFCSPCNERFWTSQGYSKHQNSPKHMAGLKKTETFSNQCWVCLQKPENLYSHLHKFHRLTTGECMALRRCMFCGSQSQTRKDLEIHMASKHGVLIKGEENKPAPVTAATPGPRAVQSTTTGKNLSTVVTGGSTGMVRNNFCVFCNAQFQDNTKLTLHCLSVHATCKKCGMVVNKSSDLNRHVCKMANKTCNLCGMKNLKPAGLIKHLETHTKPCRVVVKRLSPFQIEKATGIKMPRMEKPPLNPYCIKPKKREKVVIDLSGGTTDSRKEEVVVDSDNDSDVIIQEEERTEIVLDDSDDEVNEKPNDDQSGQRNEKDEKETVEIKDEKETVQIEDEKETVEIKDEKEIVQNKCEKETVETKDEKEESIEDAIENSNDKPDEIHENDMKEEVVDEILENEKEEVIDEIKSMKEDENSNSAINETDSIKEDIDGKVDLDKSDDNKLPVSCAEVDNSENKNLPGLEEEEDNSENHKSGVSDEEADNAGDKMDSSSSDLVGRKRSHSEDDNECKGEAKKVKTESTSDNC